MATKRERDQREARYVSARERAEKHEKVYEPTCIKPPEQFKLYKFQANKDMVARLDILPYVVGDGNPMGDKGFLHYERTIYTHMIPTPDGAARYCSLTKTFKRKRCPLGDFLARAKMTGTLTKEIIKNMDVKEMQIFNLIDLDAKEEGVQVFMFNYWEFGRLIDDKVSKKARYESFYHLNGGFTLEVSLEESTWMGKTRVKPVSIDFEPREDYPQDITKKTCCLDSILIELPYDELAKVLHQMPDDEDDTPPNRSSSNGRATKEDPDEEEEDEVEEEDDEEEEEDEDDTTAEDKGIKKGDFVTCKKLHKHELEVTKVSGDGTSLTLTDEDGKVHRAIAPSSVQLVQTADREEEEEIPKGKGKSKTGPASTKPFAGGKKPGKAKTPEPEEDEDDGDEYEEPDDDGEEDDGFDDFDDEEEEEEAPPPKKRGKK